MKKEFIKQGEQLTRCNVPSESIRSQVLGYSRRNWANSVENPYVVYLRLTEKLAGALRCNWKNVLDKELCVARIKSEIRRNFAIKVAYDCELMRECEAVAYARILNIYGEERSKGLIRKR